MMLSPRIHITSAGTGVSSNCWSLNQVATLFTAAESDFARHAGHSSTRASWGFGAVGGFNVCPIGIPVNHPLSDASCRKALRGAEVGFVQTVGHM
jgi:hypothetical protein